MKSETIQKCEQLSKDLLYGRVNPLAVKGLNPFLRLGVMGGWFLCGLTSIGALSVDTGREIHLKQLQEVDSMLRDTEIFEESHLRWLRITAETSCLRTEIVKEIQNGDGLKLVELVLKVLDLYTGENIYFKMLQARYSDPNFKQNIMQTAKDNIDHLMEMFGNDVPYLRLLESFFHCCDEDGITALFNDLEPEEVIKMSEDVPGKADPEVYSDRVATIGENVERMYKKRY